MLFKVHYLAFGFLLLETFVSTYAQSNGQQPNDPSFLSSPSKIIYLYVTSTNCQVVVDQKRVKLDEEIIVKEGSKVDLSFESMYFIRKAICVHSVDMSIINQGDLPVGEKQYKVMADNNPFKRVYGIDMIAKPYMSARWACQVTSNQTTVNNTKSVPMICEFNLKVLNETTSDATFIRKPSKTTVIYICAGVVVFIIISTQTVIILYFKVKARKMARIRRISQRASTDDNDKNRYIKATAQGQEKGIRNWLNKKTYNKDDSDIYETLEELRTSGNTTPPLPPIETIPTLKRNRPKDPEESTLPRPEAKEMSSLQRKRVPTPDTSSLQRLPAGREPRVETDISKRPPLPLPLEAVEEKATTQPQRMVPTGPSKPSKLIPGTKEKPRQVPDSIVNELGQKLKLRNVSQSMGGSAPSPSTVAPTPAPKPSNKSTSIFFKKKPPHITSTAPATNMKTPPTVSMAPQFQLPEKPNPMPTGKSGALLGLTPGPVIPVVPNLAPVPMPKPSALVSKPPRPLPLQKTPTPITTPASVVLKPPLPSPAPIQEELYQEMDELQEDIYNSDDEWCYEPLPQYNIYSS